QITYARKANFMGASWRLVDVSFTYFGGENVRTDTMLQTRWQSSLTPDKLGVVTIKPEALSIRGLQDYVNYLHANSQDTNRYELALWRKILQPLSIAVMLLMALSFIFGPLRSV